MDICWKYVFVLTWLAISFISSLFLFSRGLLLSRDVLPQRTSCLTTVPDSCYNYFETRFNFKCLENVDKRIEHQFCSKTNLKIVLIIIDALRFDFAEYDVNMSNTESPYRNKLPVFYDLLTRKRNNTRLHKFKADPPTTTMQRINGLTTGSLPTFIDIGSNFATSEINEDNIIDSIISENKRVVFMGDDTWSKLYPNRFIRNYPFDSFNVWDLDTVDNGIVSNLYTELEKSDWDLLIAHFLGVDHCGHRFGPNHSEMAKKLSEMNDILRRVSRILESKDDTLLFVIGDHGMTSTGDHGGETENEVTSALFVYSPAIELSDKGLEVSIVRQVDLVSTMCTILGISTPFSNIGSLIFDCLPISIVNSTNNFIFLLWRNIEQITAYIKEYSQRNSQFTRHHLDLIINQYDDFKNQLNDSKNIDSFIDRYKIYMKNVVEMCTEVWIQFDLFSVLIGLILMIIMTILTILVMNNLSLENFQRVFTFSYTSFCFLVIFSLTFTAFYMYVSQNHFLNLIIYSIGVFTNLQLIGIFFLFRQEMCQNLKISIRKIKLSNFFINLCYIFSLLSLFSNSYILEEPRIFSFLIITSLCTLTVDFYLQKSKENLSLKNFKITKFNIFRNNNNNYVVSNIILIVILFRGCLYFLRCREDQEKCVENKSDYTPENCILVILLLNSYIAIFRKILQYNGNSLGNFCNIIICSSLTKLNGVLISVYWIYKTFFNDKRYHYFIDRILPFSLISSISSIFLLFWDSLSVHRETMLFDKIADSDIISNFFQYTKHQEAFNQLFYKLRGITTIYAAFFANVGIFLCIICCVLSSHIYSFPTMLMVFASWYLIFVLCSLRQRTVESCSTVSEFCVVPWNTIFVWGMSSIYWFYTTGHIASFSGIQWNVAFLLQKDINGNSLLPGILVLSNTFISYIVHGFLLPMLVIFPFTINGLQPRLIPLQNPATRRFNEIALVDNDHVLYHALFKLFTKYLLFFAIRLIAMMMCTILHSRHLMMWNIFAPKLIFEGVAFITATVPSLIISYVLVIRVTKQVKKLFN